MNREARWKAEEEEYNVKVIYMEGDLLRTIKAKLIDENDAEITILRRHRRIRIPWRNVERIEHFVENEEGYEDENEDRYKEGW